MEESRNFKSRATTSLKVEARGNDTAGRGGVVLNILQVVHLSVTKSTAFKISLSSIRESFIISSVYGQVDV